MQHRPATGAGGAAPLAPHTAPGTQRGTAHESKPELHAAWRTQQRRTARRATAVVAAVIVVYVVGSQLYHYARLQHAHLHSQDVACTARLTVAGLDYGSEDRDADARVHASSRHTCARARIYAAMAAELAAKGLSLGGVMTQGLSQADLFDIQLVPSEAYASAKGSSGGAVVQRPIVKPIPRPVAVPVRAVMLPLLDVEVASQMHDAVARVLQQADMEGIAVWWQDRQLYHATVYHASSHMRPVEATAIEVEAEAAAIGTVAASTCPMQAILERLIITSFGVIVACWQVLPGSSEPAELRHALQGALPHSPPPEQQAVHEPAMLHTTVARLLLASANVAEDQNAMTAKRGSGKAKNRGSRRGAIPHEGNWAQLAAVASEELCGLRATFDELWFIEEQDLLALALQGRYTRQLAVPLRCGHETGH